MTRPIHFFGMYGMWGPLTDPGEGGFCARVGTELGPIDMHGSPRRDYDAGHIAFEIEQLPDDAIIFVQGTSLGANNTPVVGSYTKRKIHGAFGFQASMFGAKVPLTANVLFAHLFYSENPVNFGLGAYQWQPGTMNPASLHLTRKDLLHPGDYDKPSQDVFLNEMRRIIANPGD